MTKDSTYPLPFQVYVESIYRYASIAFRSSKSEPYSAYELQYVHDLNKSKGYLLYCKKKDKTYDLYIQSGLQIPLEKVRQIKEGFVEIFFVEFEHILFEIREEQLFLSFSFMDNFNRSHNVELVEGTSKKTRPMDLLSPLGSTFKNPTFFPLFCLYDFDFLRKRKARIKIDIEQRHHRSKTFVTSFLKDGKKRQLTRYAKSTQMIELFDESHTRFVEEPVKD